MILVDTHIVVWLAFEPHRISKKGLAAITNARKTGSGVGIVDVTLLELAMLATRERIELIGSLESFLQKVESTFIVFPVTGKIAQTSMQFSDRYPKDPIDRMIGAMALLEGIPLVTRDEKIRNSKEVPCIW